MCARHTQRQLAHAVPRLIVAANVLDRRPTRLDAQTAEVQLPIVFAAPAAVGQFCFCSRSVVHKSSSAELFATRTQCQNKAMKRPFAASVWKEGDWYVAQCLELDIASQGETEAEALTNLQEALELYFEPPDATRPPQVRLIEVEAGAA